MEFNYADLKIELKEELIQKKITINEQKELEQKKLEKKYYMQQEHVVDKTKDELLEKEIEFINKSALNMSKREFKSFFGISKKELNDYKIKELAEKMLSKNVSDAEFQEAERRKLEEISDDIEQQKIKQYKNNLESLADEIEDTEYTENAKEYIRKNLVIDEHKRILAKLIGTPLKYLIIIGLIISAIYVGGIIINFIVGIISILVGEIVQAAVTGFILILLLLAFIILIKNTILGE